MSQNKPASTLRPRLCAVLTDPRILGWNLFLCLASPVLGYMKFRRGFLKKNWYEVDPNRWSVPAPSPAPTELLPQFANRHVVLVGASFGELLLMEKLADGIRRASPTTRITYCLRDHHTIEQVRRLHPEQPVVDWPFDSLVPVMRWLSRVKPDAVIFTERFRFPTFVVGASKFGARVALVNGRHRNKTSAISALFQPYDRWLLGAFDLLCMQDNGQADAVRPLMRHNARAVATGDVKVDLKRTELSPWQVGELEGWLGDSEIPLIAAGSTENVNEDRFVLEAFLRAREARACRLLIAPRRLSRVPELVAMIEGLGLKASLRSKSTENDADAEVLILDTMGELAFAYRYAKTAYVGGSLDAMGHNVLEPVEWGLPVSYGMQRGHFAVLQKLCEKNGVGFRVADVESLASHWIEMLSDPSHREAISMAGRRMLDEQRGAFSRTLEELLDLVGIVNAEIEDAIASTAPAPVGP